MTEQIKFCQNLLNKIQIRIQFNRNHTIDQNRVMVNGADVQRQQMHFTELALTPIVAAGVTRGATTKTVKKAFAKGDVQAKFDALASVQRIKRAEKRQAASDFDRFKIMLARKQRSLRVRQELNKLKKAKN